MSIILIVAGGTLGAHQLEKMLANRGEERAARFVSFAVNTLLAAGVITGVYIIFDKLMGMFS